LSPRQLAIVPIFPSLDGYANQIQKELWNAGFQVDCDLDAGTTLNKKIRNNQLAQYNFIGGTYWFELKISWLCVCFSVVGQQEQANGTINIRTRDNKQHGEFKIEEVIRRFKRLAETRTNHAEDEFAGNDVQNTASSLQATTLKDEE